MFFILLIFHTIAFLFLGRVFMRRWFDGYPLVFTWVGAFLLGTLIGIPVTYVCALAFVKTNEPLLWGTLTATIAIFLVSFRFFVKSKKNTFAPIDVVIVLFSLVFSSWLMIKTLHGDSTGQIFVGSNNVFDFGLAVGLMRSMSWGANIPFMSPFFSGLPLLYHFFFIFWAAVWEYFGVPAVWSINIPSIASFAAMLVMIYYVPQIIAKQKPFVGALAVLLTITNSSLTFWRIIGERNIWHMPTYPFAGPFDGSIISIFVTLNSYVNQRHLSFSIAVALFLFLMVSNKKTGVIISFLTGLLIGWNMVIYAFVIAVISGLFVVQRKWKQLIIYVGISAAIGFLFLLPIVEFLYTALGFLKTLSGSSVPPVTWNSIDYLWQNLGLLPIVAGAGLLVLPKKARLLFSPLVVGFLFVCVLASVGQRGFEQKSYSFFVIGMDMLAAIAIGWFWQGRKLLTKIAVVTLVFVLTVSGIMNLFPIKNEFAYPLIGADSVPLVSWIRLETPKNAIFVSYADMIDPVVLAGRKNFFGFFGNIGKYDRSSVVKQIYEGNVEIARENGISYILVPKWEKNDFPYEIQLEKFPIAYEDARFRVFRVE